MNELSKNASRVVVPAVPAENIVDGNQQARSECTVSIVGTETMVADRRRPGRVLLVCDDYPEQPGDHSAESAWDKAHDWRARGYEVRVLAADPQPAGSLPSSYIETEEGWVDGVPVYRLRFAPPVRPRACRGHGSEPLLKVALERMLREFQPDLLCVMLGPFFGAIPLREAAEHGIVVELVDSERILKRQDIGLPERRARRRFRRSGAPRDPQSGSGPTPCAIGTEGRRSLRRLLRSVERR